MMRESDPVCKLKLGEIYIFFFLQLAKNIVNNMGQSLDALYFHIEVIVEEH